MAAVVVVPVGQASTASRNGGGSPARQVHALGEGGYRESFGGARPLAAQSPDDVDVVALGG
jgi:hypothetical protein